MLIDEITGRLTEAEVLCQLAEECCELSHAALKLRRALTGNNPTPVPAEAAEAALAEELADVMLTWAVYSRGRYPDEAIDDRLQDMAEEKARRWLHRLKEAGE